MDWLLYFLGVAFVLELLVWLRVMGRVRRLSELSSKSYKVVMNHAVSDHWKEQVLPHYALGLIVNSCLFLVCFLLALAPLFALFFIGLYIGLDFEELMLSWQGILAATCIAPLYYWLRNKIVSRRIGKKEKDLSASSIGYSAMDKFLHRLVLASPMRSEVLFDLECAVSPQRKELLDHGKHVFVAGLARAGTTVLMRSIYESGCFASLTYRDMPYVMAPNLGAKNHNFSRRSIEKRERAHGDRVMVDFDSPEALEEVFWRTFCGKEYITPKGLVPHRPEGEILDKFRIFVDHILTRYKKDRYLSKNNNNILRIHSIVEAYPNAVVLVPFREPLEHAYSLMKQHARFSEEGDAFVQQYMTWLVHHEFGQDHRPFLFGDTGWFGELQKIDYWLHIWITVYQHILEIVCSYPENMVLVAYEDLCTIESKTWYRVSEMIEIPVGNSNFIRSVNETPLPESKELLGKSEKVYQGLRNLSSVRSPD